MRDTLDFLAVPDRLPFPLTPFDSEEVMQNVLHQRDDSIRVAIAKHILAKVLP